MNYLHAELEAGTGDVVEVTLAGNRANVLLMDDQNFQFYKRGARYTYFGGHFTSSPAHVQVPRPGRWNLVIDLGGGGGSVSASFRIIPA